MYTLYYSYLQLILLLIITIMGLYDKIMLSLYNTANANVFKTPLLFTKYGRYRLSYFSYLFSTFQPRIGYEQTLAPEYIHWKERASLPITLLIFGATVYAGMVGCELFRKLKRIRRRDKRLERYRHYIKNDSGNILINKDIASLFSMLLCPNA